MPTYEYECEKCGIKFEKFQNMSEAPLKKCPECGGKAKRLIGAGSGIMFKGSGFHATDYPSKGSAPSCGRSTPCCGRDVPCGKNTG